MIRQKWSFVDKCSYFIKLNNDKVTVLIQPTMSFHASLKAVINSLATPSSFLLNLYFTEKNETPQKIGTKSFQVLNTTNKTPGSNCWLGRKCPSFIWNHRHDMCILRRQSTEHEQLTNDLVSSPFSCPYMAHMSSNFGRSNNFFSCNKATHGRNKKLWCKHTSWCKHISLLF